LHIVLRETKTSAKPIGMCRKPLAGRSFQSIDNFVCVANTPASAMQTPMQSVYLESLADPQILFARSHPATNAGSKEIRSRWFLFVEQDARVQSKCGQRVQRFPAT
jgi:hypothetical protein